MSCRWGEPNWHECNMCMLNTCLSCRWGKPQWQGQKLQQLQWHNLYRRIFHQNIKKNRFLDICFKINTLWKMHTLILTTKYKRPCANIIIIDYKDDIKYNYTNKTYDLWFAACPAGHVLSVKICYMFLLTANSLLQHHLQQCFSFPYLQNSSLASSSGIYFLYFKRFLGGFSLVSCSCFWLCT